MKQILNSKFKHPINRIIDFEEKTVQKAMTRKGRGTQSSLNGFETSDIFESVNGNATSSVNALRNLRSKFKEKSMPRGAKSS